MSIKTIHINQQEWRYEVSRGGVKIRYPENSKSVFIDMSKWTGWSWSELERADYKGYPPPPVIPSEVKQYIINNLLKDP